LRRYAAGSAAGRPHPDTASVLETALRVTGRSEIYQRLAGSLVADPSALSPARLAPTVTTPEGLAALARI
jgi:UDP-glucose 4-epimerase